MIRRISSITFLVSFCLVSVSRAGEFRLIVGVDATRFPGTDRVVFPSGGGVIPGTMQDGDRLGGTSDVGGVADYEGTGTPLFAPNAFGSLSFAIRRGTVPIPPSTLLPIQALDFLGGPLLDLDGDLENGERSLVPLVDTAPAIMTGSDSVIDLSVDLAHSSIRLNATDITGTNVGSPGLSPGVSTTVNVLAGSAVDGSPGDPINPSIDTRVGTLTPFDCTKGPCPGVYRIEDLGYEIWSDSIDPGSSTAGVLGTLQFLGTFSGWLVVRDPITGAFPTLAGGGLGATQWPAVDSEHVGSVVATANGLQGGSATITSGPAGDDYAYCPNDPPGNCNGGTPLTDFDGDLGAYFDAVVVPQLGADQSSFVYLASAGIGVNNSFDPVFGDTVGWDVVIVASSTTCTANSDCVDESVCTFDRCEGGFCSNEATLHGDVAHFDPEVGPAGGRACGPDRRVDIWDITAVLDGFLGMYDSGCEENNLDIAEQGAPCNSSGGTNLFDILSVLDSSQGLSPCGCQ